MSFVDFTFGHPKVKLMVRTVVLLGKLWAHSVPYVFFVLVEFSLEASSLSCFLSLSQFFYYCQISTPLPKD